jgi:polyisoprenoid-binding protein YceI
MIKNIALIALALASTVAFAAPQTMKLDLNGSQLNWNGKKVTGEHHGTIALKSGEITVDNGTVSGGHFVIDMATIKDNDLTDAAFNKKLTTHLKSDDFFDVEKFPTAEFKVTSVKPLKGAAAGKPNFEVTGDLTIKGMTNSVTFPAVITSANGATQASGHVVVDRTKWMIKYGSGKFFTGLGDHLISDEFSLDLNLSAKN